MIVREGPYITRSCIGCVHLKTKTFQVQGDSGMDCHCAYYGGIRYIGSYSANTPDWCPVPTPREVKQEDLR